MLKIAHITDTHIAAGDEKPGLQNSRTKFLGALNKIKEQEPDLIILTGDLTHPGPDRESCVWIKEKLDETGIHYLITAGNHDTPGMLQEIFNLKDQPPKVILTGAVAMKGESILFLETSSERLEMKQKSWFTKELSLHPQHNVLFMHHPPCKCGVPFMDINYPYKNPDLFLTMVKRSGKDLAIFCGHYHVEKTVNVKDPEMMIYITPPTLGCLDPDASEYIIKDPRTGWRLIEVKDQQVVKTNCFYLEDL